MPSSKRSRGPASDLVRQWVMVGEIAWAAPQVIAVRTARLVAGGWPPDARNRRELRRMVGEKASAFTHATTAAALATPVGLAGIGVAALKPVHRTVRANLRRLGR